MLTWEVFAMIAFLIAVVWYKEHMDKKDSYRKGATQGFMLGIDKTLQVMVDQRMVMRAPTDPWPTKEELVLKVVPLITANIDRELSKLKQTD